MPLVYSPIYTRIIPTVAHELKQDTVKMTPTELAVFLEGLEQSVHSADLEVLGACVLRIHGYWSKFLIIRGPIFGFPL